MAKNLGKAGLEDKVEVLVEVKVKKSKEELEEEKLVSSPVTQTKSPVVGDGPITVLLFGKIAIGIRF